MDLEKQFQELYYEVSAEIEHGEWKYEYEMMISLLRNLDKMQLLASKIFYNYENENE